MTNPENVDNLALKKAEVELKIAEKELAQLNRSIWRDIVTSAPLATVLVALIGVGAAWVSGYLNFTRLELQSQKTQLEGQVGALEQQKKELNSAVKLAEARLEKALAQSLIKSIGERTKNFALGIETTGVCDETEDVIFYNDEGQEPEGSSGRDAVIAALKQEKEGVARFLRGTETPPQTNTIANGRVEEFLDKVVSALQSEQYPIILQLSNNDPRVALDIATASKSLNLPFYVPSSLYKSVCETKSATSVMKEQASLSYNGVRSARVAAVVTLRSIGTAASKYFSVANPDYPLLTDPITGISPAGSMGAAGP